MKNSITLNQSQSTVLSKVVTGVKRRVGDRDRRDAIRQSEQLPPELHRWSSFKTPFPSVSLGGYTKYYSSRKTENSDSAPLSTFVPFLSHDPALTPALDVPPTSALFTPCTHTLNRCLRVIPESSLESMRAVNSRILTSPTSLRRKKRRQILRTPSIERDFAVHAHLLVSTYSTCETSSEFTSSPISPTSESPTSESHSSDLDHSDIDELNTPISSVEDVSEDPLLDPKSISSPHDLGLLRPGSRSSYVTARSEYFKDEIWRT